MLRPATPLSILLLIAFAFLLVSVISTPIVKGIPLASFQGVDYGVFGFCKGNQCSGIKVGYAAPTGKSDSDFSLPISARHSLTSILIVHPVAALLTLICFILAATAHLHSPSHSPRYLLALIILLLPTLLITLLAFLVDILLFVPHLQWGGWIVLASVILITTSGVITCAMRRTLVSRKARKKRIAENAEMNGENFYSRQNTLKADSPPPMSLQPTAPMVNGAPGADKLPSFATFEVNKNRRPSDEERLPLNSRSPSNRTGPSSDTMLRPGMGDEMMMDRYGGPTRGGPAGIRGGRGGWPYQGPRDEFGNPLPPSPAFGPMPPGSGQREPSIPRMRHEHSNETMNSQGSRGRGRGGYPSRGYGREGPYNGNRGGPAMNGNGRGIPLGAMAVGAGAGIVAGEMMGRGERGPPPGYGNGYSPQGRGGQGQYTRDMSPASYGGPGAYDRRPSPGPPSAPGSYGYDGRQRSPAPQRAQRFQENSPPPELPGHQPEGATGIGQAVEMDATTGSPSQTPQFGPMHNFSESDSDVQGLVGLQQNRVGSPLRHDPSLLTSPTSLYSSQNSYIPPRAAWAGGIARNNTPPLHSNQQLSPVHHSPVELPASQYHTSPQPQDQHSPIHVRNTSADNYYEDVSPRFADSDPMAQTSGVLPSALLPGHNVDAAPIHHQNHQQQQYLQPQHREERSPGGHLQPSNSYESIQEGTRSPAESDNSNFTSVSQRGVNPDWRPAPGQHIGGGGGNGGGPGGMGGNGGYGGMGVGGVPNRRPIQPAMQQQRDLLLASNPDFEVPSMAGGRGGRNGGGGRGGRGGMGGMGLGGYPGGAI